MSNSFAKTTTTTPSTSSPATSSTLCDHKVCWCGLVADVLAGRLAETSSAALTVRTRRPLAHEKGGTFTPYTRGESFRVRLAARRRHLAELVAVEKAHRLSPEEVKERRRENRLAYQQAAEKQRDLESIAFLQQLSQRPPSDGTYAGRVQRWADISVEPIVVPVEKPHISAYRCLCATCLEVRRIHKEIALRKRQQREAARKARHTMRPYGRHFCRARTVPLYTPPLDEEEQYEDVPLETEVQEEEPYIPRAPRRKPSTYWRSDYSQRRGPLSPLGLICSKATFRRDPALLARLRAKIAALREARLPSRVSSLFRILRKEAQKRFNPVVTGEKVPDIPLQDLSIDSCEEAEKLICQMEQESVPESSLTQQTTSNIVFMEAVPEEVTTIGAPQVSLRRYCKTDSSTDVPNMDRWFPIHQKAWSKTDKGQDLISLDLPFDALYKTEKDDKGDEKAVMREHVLANYLRTRQYMTCDIDIKITLNSSPFNTGVLQAAWYYQANSDRYFSRRCTAVGLSQMQHVRIDANAAESEVLTVPYRNVRSMLNIRPRYDMDSCLYLGKFIVGVLSPLQTPTSSSSSVDLTVFVKFSNVELVGMVPPDIPVMLKAEMLPMAEIAKVAALLYQQYADNNRDRPGYPFSPNVLQPTATGSLSYGDNDAHTVQAMRLDARGQTPHVEGTPDSMLISDIVSRYSYVFTKTWSATTAVGSSIMCCDASPILSLDQYSHTTINGTNVYSFPPVAVISQLFAWWRGDIKFKVKIVATPFHQGRLFFCWVPGCTKSITWEMAKSCAGTYFDLKAGETEVEIIVPFISDKPWWPHRYSNGVLAEEVVAPSQFCCFVVNRLIYTNAVASTVDVLVYQAAGDNFELSVPCQPMIGLSDIATVSGHSDSSVYARPGYYPWYVGTWRYLVNGTGLVLRYGPVSDHIAQFDNLMLPFTYAVKQKAIAQQINFTDASGRVRSLEKVSLVPVDVNDGYGSIYLALIEKKDVQDYYFNSDGKRRNRPNYDLIIKAGSTSDNKYYPGSDNLELVGTIVNPTFGSSSSLEIVDLPQCEIGNEQPAVEVRYESSVDSNAGLLTMGESFTSLKSLCRRFQRYCYLPVKVDSSQLGDISFSFPVLPQGLDLDVYTDRLNNVCRDGPIPIVLNGFRFYRGSVILKFIANDNHLDYMVQIRPDRALKNCTTSAKSVTQASSLFMHGYAATFQSSSVNPVLTLEIPFYMPGTCGLLQRPSDSVLVNNEMNRLISLGECVVSIMKGSKHNAYSSAITVFYALGDDFSPHTFQGFSPMMMVKDASPDKVVAQMADDKQDEASRKFNARLNRCINSELYGSHLVPSTSDSSVPKLVTVEHIYRDLINNHAEDIFTNFKHTHFQHVSASRDYRALAERFAKCFAEDIASRFREKFAKLDATDSNSRDLASFVEETLYDSGQLGVLTRAFEYTMKQVLVDSCQIADLEEKTTAILEKMVMGAGLSISMQSPKPFYLCACYALLEVFGISRVLSVGIVTLLEQLYTRVFKQQNSHPKCQMASGTEADEEAVRFFTSLWSALGIAFSFSGSAPKSISDGFIKLHKAVSSSTRGYNNYMSFFSDILQLLKKAVIWIKCKVLNIDNFSFALIGDRNAIINRWLTEAQSLLNPESSVNAHRNPIMVARTVYARVVGQWILRQSILHPNYKINAPSIQHYVSRLEAMERKAFYLGCSTSERVEPICLWLCGAAGMGKSHLRDPLTAAILEATTKSHPGSGAVWNVPVKDDFWTGAPGAEIFWYDDFAICEDEDTSARINMFCDIMSSGQCSLPQASVEDKGQCITPVAVVVCCNELAPKYNSMRYQAAFERRRHLLVKVVPSQWGKTRGMQEDTTMGVSFWEMVRKHTTEHPENPFPHLEFEIYKDENTKLYSYLYPAFIQWVKGDMKSRYLKNLDDYQRRMTKYHAYLTEQQCASPLEEVLSIITKENVLPAWMRKHGTVPTDDEISVIRDTYTISPEKLVSETGIMDRVMGKLKSMLGISTGQIEEDHKDCGCHPYMFANLKVDERDGKTVFLDEECCGVDEQAVITPCEAGEHCMRYSQNFFVEMNSNEKYFDRVLLSLFNNKFHPNKSIEASVVAKAVEGHKLLKQFTPIDKAIFEPNAKSFWNLKWSSWYSSAGLVTGIALSLYSIYLVVMIPKALKFSDDLNAMRMVSPPTIRAKVPISSIDTEWSNALKQELETEGMLNPIPNIQAACKDYVKRLKKSGIKKVCEEDIPNLIETASSQLIPSGDNSQVRAAKTKAGITPKVLVDGSGKVVLKTQSAGTSAHSTVNIVRILEKNTCFLAVREKGRSNDAMRPIRCLGLCDRWIILLKHYIQDIKGYADPEVYFVNKGASVRHELRDFLKLETLTYNDSEVALMRMPASINQFRDIRNHLVLESEMPYFTSDIQIVEISLGESALIHSMSAKWRHECVYEYQDVASTLPAGIQYNWSMPGRCMSVVVSQFGGQSRIVGFHIAGCATFGLAEPVIRESFNMFNPLDVEELDNKYVCQASPLVELTVNAQYEGTVKPEYAGRIESTSKIVPSAIYGYVEPQTLPAPLSKAIVGGKFSPIVSGVEANGRAPLPFDKDLLDRAQQFLYEEYMINCKPVRQWVDVLSVNDAVCGIPGLSGYESMEMNTSEGFPFTALRPTGASSKKYLFKFEDIPGGQKLVGLHSEVVGMMARKEALRNEGVIPATVFVDCLKDARIKKEKFYVPGKTRIFSVSPVDFTIQFRQYFLDIMAAQKKCRFELMHAVGINVHSLEWTQLQRYITSKGPKICCGDYTNFGPTLAPDVVERVGNVWAAWYRFYEAREVSSEELDRRELTRTIMFEEMKHALHLCGNTLYRTPCGSPSGAPPTVNVNNDVNKCLIFMAWLECWKHSPMMCNFVAFKKHCALIVYGDDIMLNISDDICEIFNNIYIQGFLARFGIVYTDAQKDGTIRPYVTINDADFLKARFRLHDTRAGIFQYALDLKALEDIPNWCHKSGDIRKNTLEVCCAGLMHAYGHGREYFDRFRARISRALIDAGIDEFTLYTWAEMEQMRHKVAPTPTLSLDQLVKLERDLNQKLKLFNGVCENITDFY